MSCNLITSDIVNSCIAVRGLSPEAWVLPFVGTTVFFTEVEDSALQVHKVVTGAGSANQLYPSSFTAFKFGLNAGSDAVVSEVRVNTHKHYFSAVLQPASVTDAERLDKMDGIILFVKDNTGKYLVYGAENGLWKSSQTKRANDNTGLLTIEYTSREGIEESQSEYELVNSLFEPIDFLDNYSFVQGTNSGVSVDATSDEPMIYRLSEIGSKEIVGDWFTAPSIITIASNQSYQIFYKTVAGIIIA